MTPPETTRLAPAADLAPRDPPPRGTLLLAGPAGGLAGGVVMAAFLAVAAALQGAGPLAAIAPMGATFADPAAYEGGAGAAALGLALHLAVSALVGWLLAVVLPRDFPARSAGVLCIGYAFLVMGVMTSEIVPAVNPVLKEEFHDLGGTWVVAHALFGLVAGYVCQRIRGALPHGAGRRVERAPLRAGA